MIKGSKILYFAFFAILFCSKNNHEVNELRKEAFKQFSDYKLDRAKELFEKSLEIESNHVPTLFMLGKIDYYQQNFTSSEINFEKLLTEKKCHPAGIYWLNKIRSLDESKRKEALKELQELSDILPNRWELIYSIGTVLEEEGRISEAIQLYQEAILEEKKLSPIYVRLEKIYEKAGYPEEARKYSLKKKLLEKAE